MTKQQSHQGCMPASWLGLGLGAYQHPSERQWQQRRQQQQRGVVQTQMRAALAASVKLPLRSLSKDSTRVSKPTCVWHRTRSGRRKQLPLPLQQQQQPAGVGVLLRVELALVGPGMLPNRMQQTSMNLQQQKGCVIMMMSVMTRQQVVQVHNSPTGSSSSSVSSQQGVWQLSAGPSNDPWLCPCTLQSMAQCI